MKPQHAASRLALMALGLVLCLSFPARGGVIYTVTDEGSSVPDQVEFSNLFGRNFRGVNASGQGFAIADPSSPTGVVPSGFGSLVHGVRSSPDGTYQVGTAFSQVTSSSPWAGYEVHNGQATALGGFPAPAGGNAPFSTAFGVSNQGAIVGEFGDPSTGSSHAYMIAPSGGVTDLGSLGGRYNAALGINSSGTVVGLSSLGQPSDLPSLGIFPFRAFVSDGHGMHDLNSLISPTAGYLLTSATGINDAGQIAAYGLDASGRRHNLILSPELLPPTPTPMTLPEPATVLLFAVIGGAAHLRFRARNREI